MVVIEPPEIEDVPPLLPLAKSEVEPAPEDPTVTVYEPAVSVWVFAENKSISPPPPPPE
jgi:hypothetical protein